MSLVTEQQLSQMKELAILCDQQEQNPHRKLAGPMAKVIEELTEICAGHRNHFSDGLIYILNDNFPWDHPFYTALSRLRSGRF